MLMKGLLDDSGPSNGSRGDGASGRDVELDAQLDLWERRWIHHLQRSLGVPPDAAFPGTEVLRVWVCICSCSQGAVPQTLASLTWPCRAFAATASRCASPEMRSCKRSYCMRFRSV